MNNKIINHNYNKIMNYIRKDLCIIIIKFIINKYIHYYFLIYMDIWDDDIGPWCSDD